MLNTNLTKAILGLFFLVLLLPALFYYFSGGESLFPSITPTDDLLTPYTSKQVIPTEIKTPYTVFISPSKTPIKDLQTPLTNITLSAILLTPKPEKIIVPKR